MNQQQNEETEELTSYQYLMNKTYHEAKSTQNPRTPKFNALMLQPILYTIEET